tara:strand:- start:378 stop:722 length:345 start_codon:yes stop_codon:yes gene_type:complete
MNEQERLDKQLRDENGKRMVAYNAHMTDERGVIWCMVSEDTAGYRPMTGKDELSMPWYLARLSDHTDENGKVDYTALWKSADKVASDWNWDNGYTPSEALRIVGSSMRVQNMEE